MRIAIIAYDFPPLNSGGTQRPYFLAKFLKNQHVDVTVFTLNETNYPTSSLNYQMEKDFIDGSNIIRTNLKKSFAQGIFQSYYFNLVDTIGARWRDELEEVIIKEHTKVPFEYMFFTCPPFSLAPLGVHISKKIRVPLILDMRDAWSQWVTSPYATYFHYRGVLKIEGEALRHAGFITYTSEQQKNDWLNLHADLQPEKFIYMPNGFKGYHESVPVKNDTIQIFYSGSFYFNPDSDRLIHANWYQKRPYQYLQYVPRVEDWKYRSPFYFFNILSQIIKLYPELASKITVRFAGKKPDWFDTMVENAGLQSQIVHLGFLNKDQIEDELSKANYFLITSAKVREGRDYSVAGKTFEYFSYKKPIIGVVCEGEQKDILETSGISVIVDPDDIDASVVRLKNFLLNRTLIPNWDYIDQFKVPKNYDNLVSVLNIEI